jgi:hypothetical protein
MENLEKFWETLELHTNRTAIMHYWNAALGDALETLNEFLYPTDELTQVYPNPRHPDCMPYYVVAYPNGKFQAFSENRDYVIDLEPNDVVKYRWDMLRFRGVLVETLEINSASDSIKSRDRNIRLGHLTMAPGEESPVYLLLVDRDNAFRDEVSQLLLKLKTPFIVTTGTRLFWDDSLMETMQERNIPLIALCEALEFKDDQFVPTEVWHGAVESFRKTLYPENLVAIPEYRFAKPDSWEICFEDEAMSYDGQLYGLDYIQYLLKYPFQLIHGSELETASGKNKPGVVRSAFSKNEMKSMPEGETPNGNSSQLYGDNGIIDRKAKEQYEQRLRELAQDRREAYAVSDHACLEKIDTELQAIDSELSGTKNIFGKTIKLDKSEKLLADRIAKNIRLAIGKISSKMPKFARYLENAIHPGCFTHYSPHGNIDWIF